MSKFVTFTVDGEKWAINIAHIICVQSSSKGNGIRRKNDLLSFLNAWISKRRIPRIPW